MRSRWIPLTLLTLAAAGLLAAIVSISVGENTVEDFRIEGAGEVQQLIAGIRQLDDRLGPDDAAIEMVVFTDVQSPRCAQYQLDVVDPLIEQYVRTGDAKMILRHYPLGVKPITLGGIASEAAGFQDRQWQFAELFMRNLDLVPEQGVSTEFLNEVAAVVPKLDVGLWEQDLDAGEAEDLAGGDEEIGTSLRLEADPAIVVTGPGGSETLEGAPSLETVEATIAEVS